MNAKDSLIPPQPIPAGAEEFSKKVSDLLDGRPKDEATVNQALEGMDELLDTIAAGLYSMASMLVGEGEESIGLVETAISRTEISRCGDAAEARQSSRRALCAAAIELIAERNPGSLAAPEGLEHASTCIEDDDLESADELPIGWTDRQDGGTYRLERRADEARFGYAVGPHSWKRFLFPPRVRLWRAPLPRANSGTSTSTTVTGSNTTSASPWAW